MFYVTLDLSQFQLVISVVVPSGDPEADQRFDQICAKIAFKAKIGLMLFNGIIIWLCAPGSCYA